MSESDKTSSDLSIPNSERHHKRRIQFGAMPDWRPHMPLAISDDLHHHWLLKFHRQFLSSHVENFAPINGDDAEFLLRHDPFVNDVIGLHTEATVGDDGGVKCRTLHLTRPDGLQIVYDVDSHSLPSEIRGLLSDPTITFIVYDSQKLDTNLYSVLPEPTAKIMDMKPIVDLIKDSYSVILGKIIDHNADIEDVIRSIVGEDHLTYSLGTYLSSNNLRAIMPLDFCGLLERKYSELATLRNTYFTKSQKFVPLPRNLLWKVEDEDDEKLSRISSTSEEIEQAFYDNKTTDTSAMKSGKSREPLLPTPQVGGFVSLTHHEPKRGPDLVFPSVLQRVEYDSNRKEWRPFAPKQDPPMMQGVQKLTLNHDAHRSVMVQPGVGMTAQTTLMTPKGRGRGYGRGRGGPSS